MPSSSSEPLEDSVPRSREAAALFGVRPRTIARWARSGRRQSLWTLGRHRRADVRELPEETPSERQELEQDAVRLYEQGWSIRQVADRFGFSYGVMYRILAGRAALRTRGGVDRPE
jgi:transposase